MSAQRPRFSFQGIRVWQLIACLTVLSFLCRAVIPVGYMPDSSQGDGKFALTFCVPGGGTGTLMVNLFGEPDQPAPTDHFSNQDCPYGIALAKAMLPAQQAPALSGVITYRPAHTTHRNQASPPLPALGPPLGPRAPPAYLG